MKKVIALVLVVVMCFAFASCDRKEKKAILGTWENKNGENITFEKRGKGEGKNIGDIRWVYDSKLECYTAFTDTGYSLSFTKVQEDDNGKYIVWEGHKFYYKE